MLEINALTKTVRIRLCTRIDFIMDINNYVFFSHGVKNHRRSYWYYSRYAPSTKWMGAAPWYVVMDDLQWPWIDSQVKSTHLDAHMNTSWEQ